MKLNNNPDWHSAAQQLVNSLASLDSPEDRIRLLDKLCDGLGGSLYPAFLQILYNVERYADEKTCQLVTDTLLLALNTGRLPAGPMAAWGSSQRVEGSAFGQSRSLGPIEYLCAWYAQPSDLPSLDESAFSTMTTSMIRLVSSNDRARQMYCQKLMEDAEDPLSGSLSGQTRTALAEFAHQWQTESPAEKIVMDFISALNSGSRLNEIQSNPFL